MINPYKISQEILKTHSVLNSLTYDLFDSLAGADRVRLNDCLNALSVLAKTIENEADKEFEEN